MATEDLLPEEAQALGNLLTSGRDGHQINLTIRGAQPNDYVFMGARDVIKGEIPTESPILLEKLRPFAQTFIPAAIEVLTGARALRGSQLTRLYLDTREPNPGPRNVVMFDFKDGPVPSAGLGLEEFCVGAWVQTVENRDPAYEDACQKMIRGLDGILDALPLLGEQLSAELVIRTFRD